MFYFLLHLLFQTKIQFSLTFYISLIFPFFVCVCLCVYRSYYQLAQLLTHFDSFLLSLSRFNNSKIVDKILKINILEDFTFFEYLTRL